MEDHSNSSEDTFGPCCFCGKDIALTNTDPCRITVETSSEKWQVWFCMLTVLRLRFSNMYKMIYPQRIFSYR